MKRLKSVVCGSVVVTSLVLGATGCSKDDPYASSHGASPTSANASSSPEAAVATARVTAKATASAAAGSPGASPGGDAPASNGGQLNDGLPDEIPSGTSKPPTVAEWNAVPREVSVRGSTERGCETKMLREWLRVSCRPKGSLEATSVATVESGGQQAYAGMFGDRASVVVQVVRGKKYTARYKWNDGVVRLLVVDWPSGAPRPTPFVLE